MERRATDPEGAITAARTLLETVCKHILDEQGLAGFEDDKPYLASGDSTAQRYIVDGEMQIVPHGCGDDLVSGHHQRPGKERCRFFPR